MFRNQRVKQVLFNQFLVICTSLSAASSIALAKVPSDWIQADPTLNSSLMQAPSLSATANENLGKELFQFYDLSEGMVTGLPQNRPAKKDEQPWYVQSMGLELGIEASGAIGLLGLGGEAAIEMIWSRTKESLARLQKEHYPTPLPSALPQSQMLGLPSQEIETELTESDLKLSSDMSERVLEKQVDELMKVLREAHTLTNPARIRQTLLREVTKLKNWVEGLEIILPESTWRPYKFQTLIKLTAEGMVQPGLEVGGTIQVKLEWTLQDRSSLAKVSKSNDFEGQSMLVVSQRNAEFLRGLSADFEILRPLMRETEYYQLTNIKLGIGLGIEGDIGIAEAEAEVFGNLFWKEFPQKPSKVLKSLNAPNEFVKLSPQSKAIPRSQWHKGLKKAMQISQYIVRNAAQYEKKKAAQTPPEKRDFELKFLEIEFEVVASGSAFLPTLSKMANADLYFVKQEKK